MRVIGCISFYDENPAWLSACVASLSKCCDHVVALDGAYRLFPQARAHSGPDQQHAIVATAQALNLGVTYSAPQHVWLNNEVEKRNRLLQLALLEAQPEDWLLIIDADSLVSEVPSDFRAVLEGSPYPVATYVIQEDFPEGSGKYPARYLYRAEPSLHIGYAHFDYRIIQDGQELCLWENGRLPAAATSLLVLHRRDKRPKGRNDRAQRYYLLRDNHGIERVAPLAQPGG